MPHPAPVARWRPEVTPAPIVEGATGPAAEPMSDWPVKRRGKTRSSTAAPAVPASLPLAEAAPNWPRFDEAGAGASVGATVPRELEASAAAAQAPGQESSARAGERTPSVTPLAIRRRRVPLISAVGLAGLLLAGLLLAGALAALQAGSAGPVPTVIPPAASAAPATPTPTPAPTSTPTAVPSPTSAAPTLPAGNAPLDQRRRTND